MRFSNVPAIGFLTKKIVIKIVCYIKFLESTHQS